jgi:hypothetical protein
MDNKAVNDALQILHGIEANKKQTAAKMKEERTKQEHAHVSLYQQMAAAKVSFIPDGKKFWQVSQTTKPYPLDEELVRTVYKAWKIKTSNAPPMTLDADVNGFMLFMKQVQAANPVESEPKMTKKSKKPLGSLVVPQ